MNRKKVIIIVGIVFGIILIASCVLILRDKLIKNPQSKVITTETVAPTPTVELATWDDPAGFSFQYPKGLVMDTHDQDQENYAHIELTDTNHPGRVIVWMKDTTFTTISDWLAGEKSLGDAMSVDTTLGGNPAVKIIVKEPKKKQIIATLDEDVVFILEAELDDQEYWMNVENTIAQSVTFITTAMSGSGDTSGSDIPAFEADEVESVE